MLKKSVAISKRDSYIYPEKKTEYRPSTEYPEYIWKDKLSKKNIVYDQVRETLYLLGYDKQNYGKKNWNPLGEIIKEGDNVLLKPNLVMENNPSGDGVECLYTQASIVAAILDYICIALKGSGKIIVGDAPMQNCDWEKLMDISGYPEMIDFYKKQGIDIKLVDFREISSTIKDAVFHQHINEEAEGIIVHLDKKSVFYDLKLKNYEKMRITNYDPDELKKHHNNDIHEYFVSKYVLDADVIINVPKPKTHRKAGFTAALKNFVGANVRKEYLPHHTFGSVEEGGDEYLKNNIIHSFQSKLLDKKNNASANNKFYKAKLYRYIIALIGRLRTDKNGYIEGSWYGNNTISKTIADLNRIVKYSDKYGIMQDKIQRRVFSVGDMIISGEKEGPVCPSAKNVGIIIAGEDIVCFDEVVCRLMGFDSNKIPTLKEARNIKSYPITEKNSKAYIYSNVKEFNEKYVDDILVDDTYSYEPTSGWKDHIEL